MLRRLIEVGSEGGGLAILLITLLVLSVASVAVIWALITQKLNLAKRVIMGILIWTGIYLGILLTVSLTSSERVIGLGEEKRFCGFYLDCHLATSVLEVGKTKIIGDRPNRNTAKGIYYIVKVKVSSDALGATLNFSNPIATIVDGQGRKYARSLDLEKQLESFQGMALEFSGPVEIGSSHPKDLVFDIPQDVRNPRLLVTEGHWIERLIELFLIGDDDSLFHKRTMFRLETKPVYEEKTYETGQQ